MTVINSNSAALRAQNGTRMSNQSLQVAMARLSSGKRINTAADDAAGLAIANSMTSQISGMNQAVRNANDGISLLQTADGALEEVTNMAQRIRELAVQSASGTYSTADRANMQSEVGALATQITSVMATTKFNGTALFDTAKYNSGAAVGAAGNGTKTTLQIGAGSSDSLDINIANLGTTLSYSTVKGKLTTATTAADATVFHTVTVDDFAAVGKIAGTTVTEADIGKTVAQGIGDRWFEVDGTGAVFTKDASLVAATDVSTAFVSAQVLSTVDSFLKTVGTARAGIGAGESRLNSVVNNLTNNVTNLSDARSRIQDADFSAETTNLAKSQILSQAATAMLAQANQSQQGVLKLLQ